MSRHVHFVGSIGLDTAEDVFATAGDQVGKYLDAGERASQLLHREVNLTRITPSMWDAGQDPFVKTLTSRPLVPIRLLQPQDHATDAPTSSRTDRG